MVSGCIERGNGDLQLKLGKWMDENGTEWSKGLKFVVHAINTSVSSTTGTSPYQVVFGQHPRADQSRWSALAAQGISDEDDLPEDVRELLQVPQDAITPPRGEGVNDGVGMNIPPRGAGNDVGNTPP